MYVSMHEIVHLYVHVCKHAGMIPPILQLKASHFVHNTTIKTLYLCTHHCNLCCRPGIVHVSSNVFRRGREGGREGGRGWRERGREGGREGRREGGREGGREGRKEGGRGMEGGKREETHTQLPNLSCDNSDFWNSSFSKCIQEFSTIFDDTMEFFIGACMEENSSATHHYTTTTDCISVLAMKINGIMHMYPYMYITLACTYVHVASNMRSTHASTEVAAVLNAYTVETGI